MAKVRWDLDELQSCIRSVKIERTNLQDRRNQMERERGDVNANWKSPAGQLYQSRLQNDIGVMDDVLTQTDRHMIALQQVADRYSDCENRVARALRRLPHATQKER